MSQHVCEYVCLCKPTVQAVPGAVGMSLVNWPV